MLLGTLHSHHNQNNSYTQASPEFFKQPDVGGQLEAKDS